MPDSMLPFKAFLSHQYKSPQVNLFFFEIFSRIAEVQFEVDEGKGDLNVTRLECMLRDADAFIGIYPFTGSPEDAEKPEALKKLSKYFRLEMDLAIRSQKPAIIFYDKRYGDLLKPPPSIFSIAFDSFEITGSGGSPQAGRFSRLFADFSSVVQRRLALDAVSPIVEKSSISLILGPPESLYTRNTVEKIEILLQKFNYNETRIFRWPPTLERTIFRQLNESNLALVDFSAQVYNTGINSFLHGCFVPMIRLYAKHNSSPDVDTLTNNFLFGGLEVGYNSDLVVWDAEENLLTLLNERLLAINRRVKRVNNFNEAKLYFESNAVRKREERVFISYSGKDIVFTTELRNSLKNHFSKVFDYKDGESITLGESWLKEIFSELSKSSYAIPLFSSDYLASKNCMHELEEIVALRDNQKIKIFPFILPSKNGQPELKDDEIPSYIRNLQYNRVSAFKSVEEITEKILRTINKFSNTQ